MKVSRSVLNIFVTAFLSVSAFTLPSVADEAKLDDLYAELAQPDIKDWEGVERKIWKEWSRSGSASMDLLLSRGRKAMEQGDFAKAIDHLTALTDHAPDFAEGWNARATAFFNADEFGLSIVDIQRALALNPRHFGALQGLGRILEELEREEDALAAYQAAAAIHPHREGLKEAIERLERKVSGQDV
ncbi:tetratricopeptide repeat protein [Litoreibacter janthinus]|uniref:Tetratricopeptide repeat-containing protein n=1 Tax=Litoreibacter janthinus TaxID=670154 RepID=A0A1I6HL58_9RHOB|nr:tetratricopeptide repeat protein [Litoreibacter janthinus]SFR55138.1 Tetratricopeptide repeat-containing protein [Litoreibacter janthinus]